MGKNNVGNDGNRSLQEQEEQENFFIPNLFQY